MHHSLTHQPIFPWLSCAWRTHTALFTHSPFTSLPIHTPTPVDSPIHQPVYPWPSTSRWFTQPCTLKDLFTHELFTNSPTPLLLAWQQSSVHPTMHEQGPIHPCTIHQFTNPSSFGQVPVIGPPNHARIGAYSPVPYSPIHQPLFSWPGNSHRSTQPCTHKGLFTHAPFTNSPTPLLLAAMRMAHPRRFLHPLIIHQSTHHCTHVRQFTHSLIPNFDPH